MAEPFLWVMDVEVGDGSMGCDAVIPQRDRALFPFDTNLEILAKGNMLRLKESSQRCEHNVSANCLSDAYVEQELQKSI